MKKVILILICLSQNLWMNEAPVFQEIHHFFNGDLTNKEDKLNYLFNGRNIKFPEKLGITIAHQNREWDYNWFIFTLVAPTNIGAFGIGYSNYGSNMIPIVDSDSIGPYIDSYSSDTFESILLSYQPKLSELNLVVLLNYKARILVTEKARASGFDFQLSSDKFLNNLVGIRTRNLFMSEYKWSDGTKEELAKYIGIYSNLPLSFTDKYGVNFNFNFFLEYDYSINYDEIDMTTMGISLRFHDSISLFATYRTSSFVNTIEYGSFLKIRRHFFLSYSSQLETYESFDQYINAISIGVNF